MFDRTQIREGMAVRASTGQKLGKVIGSDEGTFRVERRGLLGVRRYAVRFTDVQAIDGGEIVLRVEEDDLRARDQGDARITGDTPRISVERDSMRIEGNGVTRYEEYTVRVSEQNGSIERRTIRQAIGGIEEHAQQRPVEEYPEDTEDGSRAPDTLPVDEGGSPEHP